MTDPIEAFAGPAQDLQEGSAVVVGVPKMNRAPLVAARGDVVERARTFESQGPGHIPVALGWGFTKA